MTTRSSRRRPARAAGEAGKTRSTYGGVRVTTFRTALRIEVTAHPPCIDYLVFVAGRLPDIRAPEMGTVRVGIADTAQHAQLAVVVQVSEVRESGMKPCFVGQEKQFVFFHSQCGPRLVIKIVAVGHHAIQSVIPPGQLDQHQ